METALQLPGGPRREYQPPPVQMDVEDPDVEEEEEDESEEEDVYDPDPFPPPGLKEISSLASWTVSSAKPGNGVRELRSPDTSQFWQSDGPQPHLLSIHFFKLVSIVHMRVFLDFSVDESYTPTKIQFLAGMGIHDIQEFAEMSFDQPMGWIDVDFGRVGTVEKKPKSTGLRDYGDDISHSSSSDDEETNGIDWSRRPVLRAFLVQVRILENHQNGKDTHLRAVQLFARDESQESRKVTRQRRVRDYSDYERYEHIIESRYSPPAPPSKNLKLASWMLEPDLR